MIYQCSGCNQDKDDDTDIGTLIGEDYYCEGCLASRNGIIDEAIEVIKSRPEWTMANVKNDIFLSKDGLISEIESLKGE